MKGRTTVDWLGLCADYDRIRDHIEHVVPGFDDYNRGVRQPGGFYLPNPPRDKREFPHTDGEGELLRPPDPDVEAESRASSS